MLESMRQHLLTQDQLLFAQSVDPSDASAPVGGWYDRNGNGIPDTADELLIDIFKPGTNNRVIDFSTAAFVKGAAMPLGALTPTASLPTARCGYQQFHVDDVVSGANVPATDGVSFSPDGTQAVVPLTTAGKTQIYVMNTDGTAQTCLTCGQPGNNDGVRWRRGATPDAMLFVSDRDHPYAIGNDGAASGKSFTRCAPTDAADAPDVQPHLGDQLPSQLVGRRQAHRVGVDRGAARGTCLWPTSSWTHRACTLTPAGASSTTRRGGRRTVSPATARA